MSDAPIYIDLMNGNLCLVCSERFTLDIRELHSATKTQIVLNVEEKRICKYCYHCEDSLCREDGGTKQISEKYTCNKWRSL